MRTVIVTGGANGMGLASSKRLASTGWNVAICDMNEAAGEVALAELTATYPQQKFWFQKLDVTNASAVEKWVNSVAGEAGALQGLVCCAGIVIPSPRLHETSLSSFAKIMDVNLNGTVYFNAALLRHFVEQNARKTGEQYTIVNFGSKGSVEGLPGAAAYTSAKHAVLGLTRVIAKDYASENVRVNCLCPGLIWTSMMEQLTSSGKPELSKDALLKQCHTRRFGTVEEMANIVNWLMSDQSSYVTGQAIEADGMWAI